ncbi:MAG: hypothetical protein HFI05_11105 [Lachnospiraceae bacterium]|jgi:hypothetical protein|nr:hypothetical protein [Lachnospiraceae bacterium]
MKIRKINKTHIVTAIILSATFLFVGCGIGTTTSKRTIEPDTVEEEISNNKDLIKENDIKEEIQNKNITNRNDVTDNQESSSVKIDIYDYILAEYSDMVQNDFYTNLRDSDAYESSFGKDIGLEIRTHKQNIYYTFYDIDGNGTMELIIAGGENGVSNPTFSPWNYDLYGYDGTNVVHIFPEMEFGYRTNFSLYENGVIEVFYSSSAAESGVDFYRIGTDGFTPELIDSFSTVAYLEEDEPVFIYSQNGNEITEEEYNTNIQNYEIPLTTVLDWIQIQ